PNPEDCQKLETLCTHHMALYLAEPVHLKPIACCFKYTLRKIPIRFVADYSRTHKQCSSPGIILHTRRGRQICANPSDAWVQEYISNLDNSKGLAA
uniref:C-C motif chemokine n=1 Tax=Lynx canadensis TaxID=61383 RepID=A0A667I3J6_LYNCA